MAAWSSYGRIARHALQFSGAWRSCASLDALKAVGLQQDTDSLIHIPCTAAIAGSVSLDALTSRTPAWGCMQQRSFRTCMLASSEAGSSSASAHADTASTNQAQPAQGSEQTSASGTAAQVQLDAGMQELLGVLSQPLPLGTQRNFALNDAVVEMNGSFFLDPAKMMETTMRALYVIKQVLRSNGHVCVINSNPAFSPLMRHAARHCLNRNVWWHWDAYVPGTLLSTPGTMMGSAAQPARHALQARGLSMTNVHCPVPGVMDKPSPRLDTLDKWRLWNSRNSTPTGLRGRHLLRKVVQDESQAARLLLPGAGNQMTAPTLIVVLDLSYGQEVVMDAHEAGILTSSVVNAHSELDRITYPILAAEAHPQYTHFFLNWLLKVVNMPTPPLPANQ